MRGYAVGRAPILLLALGALASLEAVAYAGGGTFTNFFCAPLNANTNDINACINSSLVYVAVGLLLAFQIVAVAYLLGEVLNVQSFKGWYKNELWEAAKSIAIVGIVFALIMIVGSFASFATASATGFNGCPTSGFGSSTTNITLLYLCANDYLLQETVAVNASYMAILGTTMALLYVGSLNIMWITPGLSQIPLIVPIPPFPVVGSINFGISSIEFYQSNVFRYNPIGWPGGIVQDTLTILIMPLMLAIDAQYYLLLTFMAIGLGVFMPLGVILRAFPFLRPIGGTFLALAIGASLIYPATLVFFNIPMTEYFQSVYLAIQPGPTSALSGFPCNGGGALCTVIGSILYLFATPFQTLFLGISNGQVQSAFFNSYNAAAGAMLSGNVMPGLTTVFIFADLPMMVQFILFILDLMVVLTLTQNMAKMLGGNLRLSIGKMKLA